MLVLINHKIAKRVDKRIDTIFKSKPEIAGWLKRHERKHLLIERLTGEINAMVSDMNILVTDDIVNRLADDFTLIFARAAIKQKEVEINKLIKSNPMDDVKDIAVEKILTDSVITDK